MILSYKILNWFMNTFCMIKCFYLEYVCIPTYQKMVFAPLWGVIMTISFCYFYVADIPRWENATSKSQMFLTIRGGLFIQSVAVVWYSHIWYNSNQYAQGYLVSWINLQFSPRAVKAIYLFKTELKYTNQSSNLLVLRKVYQHSDKTIWCSHILY